MSEFDPQAMDNAAHEAEQDLLGSDGAKENYPTEAIDAIAGWWFKWFLKTGHKRLGRILVGIAKDHTKKEV